MTLVENVQKMYGHVDKLYTKIVEMNMGITQMMENAPASQSDCVDIGFMLREMAEKCDEIRKELNSRREPLERIIGVRIIESFQGGESTQLNAAGTMATATPDVKPIPYIPRKGTEEYEMLCRTLGFPEETIKRKLAEPHWKHLQEYATELAAVGQSIPGLKTTTKVTVTFRKRRDSV